MGEAPAITGASIHYVSRDVEYHRKLYAQGYENLRLYQLGTEDLSKLKLENAELRMEVDKVNKRLETIERLLTSGFEKRLTKEAVDSLSGEGLEKRVKREYVSES